MPTINGTESAASPYQLQLFSNLPLYTTQLVCETQFPFCERIQVSAPADVVPILHEYFRLKDREEMILVLLDRFWRYKSRFCTTLFPGNPLSLGN